MCQNYMAGSLWFGLLSHAQKERNQQMSLKDKSGGR